MSLAVGHPSYWFAFHPYQKTFLENASEGFLVLGCGSPETIFIAPAKDLFAWLPDMWTTERDGRVYWHIRIHFDGTEYMMDRKEGRGRIDITRFLLM